jgi:hypothetical protein
VSWILESLCSGIPELKETVRTVFTDDKISTDAILTGIHPGVVHRICTWHLKNGTKFPNEYKRLLWLAMEAKTRQQFLTIMEAARAYALESVDAKDLMPHLKTKLDQAELWAGYAARSQFTLFKRVSSPTKLDSLFCLTLSIISTIFSDSYANQLAPRHSRRRQQRASTASSLAFAARNRDASTSSIKSRCCFVESYRTRQ